MSNWTGAARSNYFAVKNRKKFEQLCNLLDINIEEKGGKIAVFANTENGDWPTSVCLDEGSPFEQHPGINAEAEEIDFPIALSAFLRKGEIAVLMECGRERMRYLTGWAVAIHSDGRTVSLSLNNIYGLAAAEFGVAEDSISRAQY